MSPHAIVSSHDFYSCNISSSNGLLMRRLLLRHLLQHRSPLVMSPLAMSSPVTVSSCDVSSGDVSCSDNFLRRHFSMRRSHPSSYRAANFSSSGRLLLPLCSKLISLCIFSLSSNSTVRNKYFHPDNMSSEEKLKIELAKVRDEFKMSESDCG
ncbi:uncharacterized protein DS421_19g657950 [Arachis hypogaea]|uniref:Uncharacterized protein n=1 Tax=Arachis hypogaea TaxID=3818 RepID=A0A6B9VBF3_ARAHY|nr:uncharacterized protein DS421_19g657950 [Arachis hypogaea]